MRTRTRAGGVSLLLVATVALSACGDASTPESSPATSTESRAEEVAATGSADDTSTPAAACPDDAFLLEVNDVARTDGYADPELAVTCSATTLTITSNGMIAYEFVPMTPNDLLPQGIDVEIPLTPVAADEPGAIGLGGIGVAVNGAWMFGAFEAPRDGYRDPLADGLLDFCNGHTGPQGEYHYHARFDCLFDDPVQADLVYGYVYDGYAVVSPYVCADAACASLDAVTSSYQRTGDGVGAFEDYAYVEGSGDLDECNGMVGDDGTYRYFATDGFPYLPFCYHGETSMAQGTFDGTPPAGGPAA